MLKETWSVTREPSTPLALTSHVLELKWAKQAHPLPLPSHLLLNFSHAFLCGCHSHGRRVQETKIEVLYSFISKSTTQLSYSASFLNVLFLYTCKLFVYSYDTTLAAY